MEIKQPGMSAGKTVYKSIGFMQSVVSGCGYIGVYGFCQKPLR